MSVDILANTDCCNDSCASTLPLIAYIHHFWHICALSYLHVCMYPFNQISHKTVFNQLYRTSGLSAKNGRNSFVPPVKNNTAFYFWNICVCKLPVGTKYVKVNVSLCDIAIKWTIKIVSDFTVCAV